MTRPPRNGNRARVLLYVNLGRSRSWIAKELSITLSTVYGHIYQLRKQGRLPPA